MTPFGDPEDFLKAVVRVVAVPYSRAAEEKTE